MDWNWKKEKTNKKVTFENKQIPKRKKNPTPITSNKKKEEDRNLTPIKIFRLKLKRKRIKYQKLGQRDK